jgi:hypothetical protein
MNNLKLLAAVVGTAFALLLPSAPAEAQATRTWVSGVGDDANPCSRTAPCKTWAGAISKTANGGEIDALDPGGFGALTITKSITLDGGGGQVASTLVAGTNGLNISAQPNDVVIIRNLRLDGLLGNGGNPANAGQQGIRITGGREVTIQNTNIFGFALNCIDIEPTAVLLVAISNSSVDNCAGAGILVQPSGGANVNVSIDRLLAFNTANGILVNGTSGGTTQVQVLDSNITGNATSGVTAQTTSAVTNLFVHNSMISRDGTGVISNGAQASVLLSQTVITGNTTAAMSSLNGGSLFTYHNDPVNANPGGAGSAPTQINPL